MNTHLRHCSRLNNKSFDTILIGDSLIAGLARYSKVWKKFFKPLNTFNCGIGGNRVQHVLCRAHDCCCFSSLRNVIICGTNNLYQDLPEDIANGLIEIVNCFKQGNNAINVFICGLLPYDDTSSINCQLIKETNNILKSSCSVNHIKFIDQDSNWIQMDGTLKPDLFYSDKLHLVEKGNLILAKSIYISVKSLFRSQNDYQLSKTFKSVTIFSLNNTDFPIVSPLSPRKPVS